MFILTIIGALFLLWVIVLLVSIAYDPTNKPKYNYSLEKAGITDFKEMKEEKHRRHDQEMLKQFAPTDYEKILCKCGHTNAQHHRPEKQNTPGCMPEKRCCKECNRFDYDEIANNN